MNKLKQLVQDLVTEDLSFLVFLLFAIWVGMGAIGVVAVAGASRDFMFFYTIAWITPLIFSLFSAFIIVLIAFFKKLLS